MVDRMSSRASARPIGYRRAEYGRTTVKRLGRCGECQAGGPVAEVGVPMVRTTAAASVARPALRIGQVDVEHAAARTTEVSELDRVLRGRLVSGAVVLVAGEPGTGKSTVLLDFAARAARGGRCTRHHRCDRATDRLHRQPGIHGRVGGKETVDVSEPKELARTTCMLVTTEESIRPRSPSWRMYSST
jgi:Mrp family chromosome partitioning ATPase